MKTALARLWRTLEREPVLAGVEAQWKDWLGSDFAGARLLLKPEQALASSFPCPNSLGHGCSRRVVSHAPDDIVAVCGQASPVCDSVKLGRRELVVYALDARRIAAALAHLIHPDDPAPVKEHMPGAWFLGTFTAGGSAHAPAYFLLSPDLLVAVAVELLAIHPTGRVLLVLASPAHVRTLQTVRGGERLAFAFCSDLFSSVSKNGLVPAPSAAEAQEHLRSSLPAPTQGTAQNQSELTMYSSEHPEGRTISVSELVRIMEGPFDLLVNGSASLPLARRRARDGSLKQVKLTAMEFETLHRYVQRASTKQGPCSPNELRVSEQSADAAAKTFRRMRQKIDCRVTGQVYELFKQSRSFDGGQALYMFDPDKALSYCVIVRAE